jgi:hypothetical protein
LNDLKNKLKVVLLGEPYHARVFSNQINETLKNILIAEYFESYSEDLAFKDVDIIHLISPPLKLVKKLLVYKKPIFFHWIGTDVYRFAKDSFLKKQIKKLLIKSSGIHNLAVNSKLKEELEDMGILSEVLPLVKLDFVKEPPPFPEKFSVLAYLPKPRWQFYKGDMIMQIAGLLPEIDFHVLSSGNISNKPLNVSTYDFIEDMDAAYKRSNVLLRITEHDGLAKMVLEALSYGRHVIWSSPFPYAHLVDSVEKSITTIKSLKNNPDYNLEGKKFVELNYNPVNICSDYSNMCKQIVESYG